MLSTKHPKIICSSPLNIRQTWLTSPFELPKGPIVICKIVISYDDGNQRFGRHLSPCELPKGPRTIGKIDIFYNDDNLRFWRHLTSSLKGETWGKTSWHLGFKSIYFILYNSIVQLQSIWKWFARWHVEEYTICSQRKRIGNENTNPVMCFIQLYWNPLIQNRKHPKTYFS